ncbi:Uncharacterised protein [Vibrio cholerae]|nr:Uncharacterised protein [Vibrio cholerae]CSB38592.1 Uncharacterised protein [Vibrio cholerae]CSB75692.1 Uncharacterised protein [Vibrio cholerae]
MLLLYRFYKSSDKKSNIGRYLWLRCPKRQRLLRRKLCMWTKHFIMNSRLIHTKRQ